MPGTPGFLADTPELPDELPEALKFLTGPPRPWSAHGLEVESSNQ